MHILCKRDILQTTHKSPMLRRRAFTIRWQTVRICPHYQPAVLRAISFSEAEPAMAKSASPKSKRTPAKAKRTAAAPAARSPAPSGESTRRTGEFRIGFLIHDVSRMRRTLYDQAVRPLGITRSQWWVLANLSRRQEGLTQTELAELLEVGKVTLGGLIDRLEIGGHVERRAVDHDRRAKQVVITERGERTLEAMREIGRRLNGQILKNLTRAKVLETEEVLHTMKDNLREALADAPLADDDEL